MLGFPARLRRAKAGRRFRARPRGGAERRAGFTLIEFQMAIIISAIAISGVAVVLVNSLRQVEALEQLAQTSVFISTDTAKLVATSYSAAFAQPASYLSERADVVNATAVNALALSSPVSVYASSITAALVLSPLSP